MMVNGIHRDHRNPQPSTSADLNSLYHRAAQTNCGCFQWPLDPLGWEKMVVILPCLIIFLYPYLPLVTFFLPLFTLVYNLFTFIYHYLPLFIIIYHDLPSLTALVTGALGAEAWGRAGATSLHGRRQGTT